MKLKLPQGWKLARCEDVIDVRDGTHYTPKYFSSGYPFITSKNLKPEGIDFSEVSYISEKDHREFSQRSKVERGDILYAMIGTIGNPVLVEVDTEFSIKNVALFKFSKSCISNKYFKYLLETPLITRQINVEQRGGTQKFVSLKVLRGLSIPYPPIAEQRRIAEILDRADAIRRKRQEAIALTEELLRSTFLEMFGDPVKNPKGWKTAKLDDLLLDIESGWSPECDSRKAHDHEWGVLKLGAITSGHFKPSENKALLPNTVCRPELEVKPGDLLFSRKNTYELVGASAFVCTTQSKLMISDLIFRLRLTDAVSPIYVWQALSQKKTRIELSQLANGSSGSMPNISKARLRTLFLPIPPLEEQLRYENVVNQFWKNEAHQKESLSAINTFFNPWRVNSSPLCGVKCRDERIHPQTT